MVVGDNGHAEQARHTFCMDVYWPGCRAARDLNLCGFCRGVMTKKPHLERIKADVVTATANKDHRQLDEIILRTILTYATSGDISPLTISIQTISHKYKEYTELAAKTLEIASLGQLKYEPSRRLVLKTKATVDKKSIRSALIGKGVTHSFCLGNHPKPSRPSPPPSPADSASQARAAPPPVIRTRQQTKRALSPQEAPLPTNRKRPPANRAVQTRVTCPPAAWKETTSAPEPPVDIKEELRKFLVTIHNKMYKTGYMAGQNRIFGELVTLARAHGVKTDPKLFGKYGLPRGKTQEEMG